MDQVKAVEDIECGNLAMCDRQLVSCTQVKEDKLIVNNYDIYFEGDVRDTFYD